MSYTAKELEEGRGSTATDSNDRDGAPSSTPLPSLPHPPSSSVSSPPTTASPPPAASPPSTTSLPPVSSLPRATSTLLAAATGPHIGQPQPQHPTPEIQQQIAPGAPHTATQDVQNSSYLHHTDKFWSLYLKDVDTEDEHLVQSWKGDTDGILIFTGLFAATVAAFVAQTYQLLIPSSEDTSVAIQLQISQQIAGLSNGTFIPAYTPSPFEAPFYAVWVNTLWFLSLFLSLTGALMATLMQQWTRRYLRGIRYRSAPHIRGAMHVKLRLGVKKYKMKQAVTLITSILHASVFIFFAGLVGFAFNLNSTVANVLATFVSALAAAYLVLSVLPMFSTISPYDTVLTPALQSAQRLCRTLFALALEGARTTSRKRQLHSRYLAQDEARNSPVNAEGTKERRPRSREQELMHMVRENDYSPASHFYYTLGRILTNADEHHKIQELLDSMTILLSGDFHVHIYLQFTALDESQVGQHLFEKMSLFLQSCFHFNHSGPSQSVRIKYLRAVMGLVRYYAIQSLIRRASSANPSPYHRFLQYVAENPNSSTVFPSQLITIRSYMEENVDGEIHRYSLTDMRAIAHGWYNPGIDSVEWPLFCLVELVCTILKSVISDGVDGPVSACQALWEPILDSAKTSVISYIRNNLDESELEDVIVEPIPRALLTSAGLEHLVHSFYSPPARRPPTKEEQLKIESAILKYPALADALREVALTSSLIPLYGPLPWPNLESECPPVRRRPATASVSALVDVGWVSFGPLTWRKQPAEQYRGLLRAWGPFVFTDIIDDACEVLKDDSRGVGYARICFKYGSSARAFVDEWTQDRPRAYRNVTAEILYDDRDGGDDDSAPDGVNAREEDEAQGRNQIGISDPGHT